MPSKKIYVGSDHAGYELKSQLLTELPKLFPGLEFVDCGCVSKESVDYPVYAEKVAKSVVSEPEGRGILICGSGLGMCVAANKVAGIRATSSWNEESAKLSREHNDSNIICLGARLTPPDIAINAVKVWLNTSFLGERHLNRIKLIKQLENKE